MPGELQITANTWFSCTKYVISAGLLWWISLEAYIGGVSKLQKYQQVWKKEKNEIWNRG